MRGERDVSVCLCVCVHAIWRLCCVCTYVYASVHAHTYGTGVFVYGLPHVHHICQPTQPVSCTVCCPLRLASEEKFLLDRVMRVEKHFASLALDMGLLIRKVAKTRNRGDAMAQTLQSHADSEEGSMKQSLCAVAECFAALEDYRQVLVDRLEAKVHRPLLNFDGTCRKAKVNREGPFNYFLALGCVRVY